MGKIYVGQDYKVNITLNEDITGSQSVKIAYKHNNGTSGEWNAYIIDSLIGKIAYDVLADENKLSGDIKVWARVTDADGLYFPSTTATYTIHKEGN